MSIRIKSLECHIGCIVVEGGGHEPEVTTPTTGRWQVECSGCGTVLRVFNNAGSAYTLAVQHALNQEVKS
jgi:hypothetical protein